jgi:putative addiction module antidote
MNAALKITKIGNSAGIILPKALLEQLNAQVGDELTVVETENGIELIARYPDVDQQLAVAKEVMARRRRALMALAETIMAEDREILRALAKS